MSRETYLAALVIAVSGTFGVLSLGATPQFRDLTLTEEATAVPFGQFDDGGFFSNCPSAPNSTCLACTPHLSCEPSSEGGCAASGGGDGCTNGNSVTWCEDSIWYWRVCYDALNPCGVSMVRQPCVQGLVNGSLSCTLPDPNVCVAGGATFCNGCK